MNLNTFKGFDYESVDADEEVMLSELPLSIITNSIKEQFREPIRFGKNDFVQTFETRYVVTKNNMDEENEDETSRAIDEILKYDFECIYKKVTREVNYDKILTT